jgi:hypothetical protein
MHQLLPLEQLTTSAVPKMHNGLWRPDSPTVFIISKATYKHYTTSLQLLSMDLVAHCPTLEAARESLRALSERHAGSVFMEEGENHPEVRISIKGAVHKFWVSEVGHVRVLASMNLGGPDMPRSSS